MSVASDRAPTPKGPLIAHLAVLGVGFIVFAAVAARGWFFFDDWYFVRQPASEIWSPHVGHWNTVPGLVFLGIKSLFGMDHYLPFAMPAILAHLGAVHLVWRITLRAGVRPWLATAVSVLLTFLGAGAEGLGWAVQIGFVGAITGMLGAIVLLDRPGLTPFRGVAAGALVLLAVASSGTAVPFVLVAVLLAWVRHGAVRTVGVFVVPGAAYVAWFLVLGRTAPASDRASGIEELLTVPQFAVSLLSDGLGRMFPVVVLGGLLFVALSVWWIFTFRSAASAALPAYLLFIAAPVFALLTGYSRIGNGLETATSSRYVYLVVIAIAPLMALALDHITRRASIAPVVATVLLVALWNMGGTAIALNERINRVDGTRAELAATAALIRAEPNCLSDDAVPSPLWAPDVTVGDVRDWIEEGSYHPAPVPVDPAGCDS